MISRRLLLGSALLYGGLHEKSASAATSLPLKIGLIDDLTGPYSIISGPGSVVAAQMAIDAEGGKVLGRPIQLLVANDMNKPDVGLGIARQWLAEQDVAMITGMSNSSVAMGVQDLVHNKGRINIVAEGSSDDLIGRMCSPNGIHWNFSNSAVATSLAEAIVPNGGDTWFFITVDYDFGRQLQSVAAKAVERLGGRVLGNALHPLGTSDFSSYVLSAKVSGAKIVALANGGTDTTNCLKSAAEFGITGSSQRLTTFFVQPQTVKEMGQDAMKGLLSPATFFSGMNPEALAWSHAFAKMSPQNQPPSMSHADVYTAIRYYLRIVADAGTDEAGPVLAKMRETPVVDFTTKAARVRGDGQVLRDLYLVEVKPPGARDDPFDYFKRVATISGETAFGNAPSPDCKLG